MDTATQAEPKTSPVETKVQQDDYFGFIETDRFIFPDGVTYLEYKVMNEGDRSRFQSLTQKDVVLERVSGNARMKVDQATERHELIKISATGWNLQRAGTPVPFVKKELADFLQLADPKLIAAIEKKIRQSNPWMLEDVTVEGIDKQIEELQEQRKIIEERQQGE